MTLELRTHKSVQSDMSSTVILGDGNVAAARQTTWDALNPGHTGRGDDTDSFGSVSVPIRDFQVNANLQVTVAGFINPTLLIRSMILDVRAGLGETHSLPRCVWPLALASALANCFWSRKRKAFPVWALRNRGGRPLGLEGQNIDRSVREVTGVTLQMSCKEMSTTSPIVRWSGVRPCKDMRVCVIGHTHPDSYTS